MWVVLDKDEKAMAYMVDEVEADCFKEVYYPAGRVVYRWVSIYEEDV